MEIKLVQTCGGCPEQYDACIGDKVVGYLRLRHGYFYAECYGQLVYEAYPDGDGLFACYERKNYLNAAKQAILLKLLEKNFE